MATVPITPTPNHQGKAKRWYMAFNKKIRIIK